MWNIEFLGVQNGLRGKLELARIGVVTNCFFLEKQFFLILFRVLCYFQH